MIKQTKGKALALAAASAVLVSNAMAVDASAFTTEMTNSLTELDALFTVGATIVIAFFVWGVLKKGVRSSK